MRSIVPIAFLTAAFTGLLAVAQPPQKPVPAAPQVSKSNPPAGAEPQTIDPSSDVAFQLGRLSAQMEDLQTKYSTLVQGELQKHPGYQWDPRTSKLVLIPKAKPAEKGK